MRTLTTVVLALQFAAIPLAAQAQLANTTAYTTAAVTVRARPDARAKLLARLAAESPVQVSACDNGWCQIAVNGIAGYLPRLSLSQQPNGSCTEGVGYTNSQGNRVRSPTRTPDNQPPAGASAHCRDGTYSFSQSRGEPFRLASSPILADGPRVQQTCPMMPQEHLNTPLQTLDNSCL